MLPPKISEPPQAATASNIPFVPLPIRPAVEKAPQIEPVVSVPKPEEKAESSFPEKTDVASISPPFQSLRSAEKETSRLPLIDFEAERPKPEPAAAPSTPDQPSEPGLPKEIREFFLNNGERILGRILSETPDTIYLNHDTLGVLTIPRAQIARSLVEVILINGDRVVGDILNETPESLVMRHSSLGILTVPQAHRSTRVVEALLKDGDRILGEVLAETENFTVIRSATLGTVAVQHNHVAMLNRKIEQIQLRSLPQAVPAIEDSPSE